MAFPRGKSRLSLSVSRGFPSRQITAFPSGEPWFLLLVSRVFCSRPVMVFPLLENKAELPILSTYN
jgi:hypothetical protein